jgi:hypothetical protein
MTDLATHIYEMKQRNGEFSKEPCKEGEHDYSEHRLKGFPGHDYYVYYCRICGRDKPDLFVQEVFKNPKITPRNCDNCSEKEVCNP